MTNRPVTRGEIVQAVKSERRRTLALLRPLDAVRFDAPALPGWRIREVVAHLITLDKATVLGSELVVVFRPMHSIERWNDRQVPRWANRPVPDLLLGLERWGRRLARVFRAIPERLYRVPVPTFLGRAPLAMLIWSRVYDEWIHRQDIRRALGMSDEDVDVEPAVEFLLAAIGIDTIHRLRGRPGVVVLSAKDASVPAWRFDLASGTGGPDDPSGPADVRISVPAPALIMAASGRDSFDSLLAGGTVSVEGDEELTRSFLGAIQIR